MKVVSFGGHGINDGVNYRTSLEAGGHTPADVSPEFALRDSGGAMIGGATTPARYLVLRTVLEPGAYTRRFLQAQWYDWFRPSARRIGALVIEDDDGENERYMPVMPISIVHEDGGDGLVLLTMVAVHDEEMWRSVVEDEEEWLITASGVTKVITNGSGPRNQDAFPVYSFTPATNKSAGDNLGVFSTVPWPADQAGVGYPVDVADGALDSAALIAAGKMQADGGDVIVHVDGVYHIPTLAGVNTANTKVWVRLDFAPGQEFTLSAARASGSTSDIGVGEDVGAMPNVGIVRIDGELFTYTGKNVEARMLTGVSPGVKGTAPAGHSAGAAVEWIQHDIRILYGVFIPDEVMEPRRIPLFDYAASTNTSWVFGNFADADDEERPGQWRFGPATNALGYGANRNGGAVSLFAELGMVTNAAGTAQYGGAWTLYNPCGIVGANFSNGERYHAVRAVSWSAAVRSSIDGNSYVVDYAIPKPSAANSWESWSRNAASLPAGTRYVQLYMAGVATATRIQYLECGDVTVSLDGSRTPSAALGTEEVGYPLRAVVRNTTTGEEIVVMFNMGLNTTLEVDTDLLRVRYLEDGSNQFRAVSKPGEGRDTMLRLAAGGNILEFVDEATGQVTMGIRWRKRWVD